MHGPEGYEDCYSVWCACGFRAPVFYLDPDELGLKLKTSNKKIDKYHIKDKDTLQNNKICEDDLFNLGFKKHTYYTVSNSLVYKLGRHRHLTLGCAGTPNEVLYICETDDPDEQNISDVICLHNWDYDRYLTIEKVKGLINLITGNSLV